ANTPYTSPLISIQNYYPPQIPPAASRAVNVGARANLAPATKRAAHANLRPNSDNQRHANIKQPVTPAVSDWVEHARLKCVCSLDAAEIASFISKERRLDS